MDTTTFINARETFLYGKNINLQTMDDRGISILFSNAWEWCPGSEKYLALKAEMVRRGINR